MGHWMETKLQAIEIAESVRCNTARAILRETYAELSERAGAWIKFARGTDTSQARPGSVKYTNFGYGVEVLQIDLMANNGMLGWMWTTFSIPVGALEDLEAYIRRLYPWLPIVPDVTYEAYEPALLAA